MNKNLYYLDEDIIIDILIKSADTNRTLQYYLQAYNQETMTYDSVYTGKIFVEKNKTEISIYLNEILRTLTQDYKYAFLNELTFEDKNIIYNDYILYVIDSDGQKSVEFSVIFSNRYANKFYKFPLNETPKNNSEQNQLIIEGDLLPRIPLIATENFSMGATFSMGGTTTPVTETKPIYTAYAGYPLVEVEYPSYYGISGLNLPLSEWLRDTWNTDDSRIGIIDKERCTEIYQIYGKVVSPYYSKVDFENDCQNLPYTVSQQTIDEFWENKEGVLYEKEYYMDSDVSEFSMYISQTSSQFQGKLAITLKVIDDINVIDVAYVDKCPARYYVKWVDRYGGIQCQPFEGKTTFNSNYESQVIMNQYERERKINWVYSNKWTLNTGYIKDEDYPVYESIFVSPYVQLYDTEQDRCFDVMVSNTDYTEKNYKTSKKMLSFNITLVENQKKKEIN